MLNIQKAIDNDLPLPGNMPTFGYQTARDFGFRIVQSIMMDAATTRRWYYIVSMGRKAGHLALGIGKAPGATSYVIIGEEFRDRIISFEAVCDILEASIIKKRAQEILTAWLFLRGIITRIDQEDLDEHPYVNLKRICTGT
ncbi:MAG: 6-phosphofructokinase [Ignavibacteria bacterium]|nr:6-phosphofructokinase [Ignavibacteria bacterium]